MGTTFGSLPLNDSPRTAVFRAIDDLLRQAPTLKAIFRRPGSFKSWRGDETDKAELASEQAPAIRLTPTPGEESYWYPGAMSGWLMIEIETVVKGLRIDDVDNLMYAIKQVLVPRDMTAQEAVRQTVKKAGAMTGIFFISRPLYDPRPDLGASGQFYPIGQIKIEVITS